MKTKFTWKRGLCILAGAIVLALSPGCGDARQSPFGAVKETEREDQFVFLENLEIKDITNKKASFHIFMPRGSEVNDGFGFYNDHGIYYNATVNQTGDFEDYYETMLKYWTGPDDDYTDIYSSGVLENGDDRYFIFTGKEVYEGKPHEIRRVEYVVNQPSGDYINWSIGMVQDNMDEETNQIIAELEECYGIDLGQLKKGSQLKKDVCDQDEYLVKEGDKELKELGGYKYLGAAELTDYSGEGVCPVIMPRGYYTNVKTDHAYAFLHGVWVTMDVEQFYLGSNVLRELKSSTDHKYESRCEDTKSVRDVKKSKMMSVPGFETALYSVVSYEKKGYGTEEYFPKAETLCYMQYDEEHYLALEIFVSGDKCDDFTNDVIRELETAYGIDLLSYYQKETTEDPNSREGVTLAELRGGSDMKEEALPETILWFNATYAPLTYSNGWDWKLVGGIEPTEENIEIEKSILRRSWDVHDRESAIETVERLKEQGHRAACRECIEELEKWHLLDLEEEEFIERLGKCAMPDKSNRHVIAYHMYHAGLDADYIAAWDLCRVNQLYAGFYVCGYMTYEEAMDASLENSLTLQKMYDSWEEMMKGYLLGYQFWTEDLNAKGNSRTKERKDVYEMILQIEDNPYVLDWDMKLKKSW